MTPETCFTKPPSAWSVAAVRAPKAAGSGAFYGDSDTAVNRRRNADHGFFRDNFFLTRSGLDGIWAHGKAVHIAGFAEFLRRLLL
jgi:hypothetical protein